MSENKKKETLIMGKIFAVSVLVLVVFFAGALSNSGFGTSILDDFAAASGGNSNVVTGDSAVAIDSYFKDTDVPRGNGSFLLIEYSDLECPFCKSFHPTLSELLDTDEITWIYRHLPLPFHATAEEGAVLAECSRIHKGDDAFWDFIDGAFDSPVALSSAVYSSLAAGVGLSETQINKCLAADSEARGVVAENIQSARSLGFNGTPSTLVVNLKTGETDQIPGALPLESVREILNSLR